MPTLDQARPARSSITWTGELVRQRLVEAFAIDRRMPDKRHGKIGSAWPATTLHEWTDIVHWTDARERVWQSWEKPSGASPPEVSRMFEAFDWLRWLQGDELIWLKAWAFALARGMSVTAIIEKRGIARTTFYRTIDIAATRIADRLNQQGVTVR